MLKMKHPKEKSEKQLQKSLILYPWIEVYRKRKAETPPKSPILASRIFCSSTRVAMDFMDSDKKDDDGERAVPNSGSVPLIL